MIELTLLRHAATEWNADKRLQGRTDIPLSAAGRADLKGLRIAPAWRNYHWYSSPLLRCCQTAELLGIDNPDLSDAWIEMSWGDWEGQRIDDLRQQQPELMQQLESQGLDLTPPNGESPRQVRLRVLQWLAQQDTSADRRIGVVCHKGVIRALLSEALDWDMKTQCPVKIDWKAALHFNWDQNTGLQLTGYNTPLQGQLSV